MDDNLQLIHGQGGHCNLGPVTDQLMTFLFKHLFPGQKVEVRKFSQQHLTDPDRLTVTATGQASTSLNSLSVEAIARRDAAKLMASIKSSRIRSRSLRFKGRFGPMSASLQL